MVSYNIGEKTSIFYVIKHYLKIHFNGFIIDYFKEMKLYQIYSPGVKYFVRRLSGSKGIWPTSYGLPVFASVMKSSHRETNDLNPPK